MKPRLFFLLGLAVSWFLAVALRLYQLQVVDHDHYQERADRQQNQVVTLTPPRGTIYDRRGHELAVSVEVRSLYADATRVEDPEAAAKALSPLLGKKAAEIAEDLASKRSFVWVKRKLDPPTAAKVEALLVEKEIQGFHFIPENKRYYPLGSLAAQVLGYVGTDNQGLAGLEYLYDNVVAAEPTKRTVLRDALAGTVLSPRQLESAEAKPGQDLHLTLDAALQNVAESELLAAVRSSGARRGMAVVMDPKTGAILAMASYPGFDPNHFGDYPEESWRNQVVMDAYEPGSTFKMVTVAAALEAGAVHPRSVYDCGMGGIVLTGTRINDHKPFGLLTVHQIIAQSSNVGAIKIGLAAGRQKLAETIEAFGFGRPTGVDLPSESAGILRPLSRWSALAPAYHSFGQGLSVTALQLVNAFAVIANGGQLLKPYVVETVDREGEPPTPMGGRRVKGLPISPSSIAEIKEMLESVVNEGTAKSAQIDGYRAAGKTGTAQKAVPGGGYAARRYVASFVGFAPVDDPALVAAVILDEPWPRYHGGEVAAPAWKAIAEKTLHYLGVRPDREPPRQWPGERIDDADFPQVVLASSDGRRPYSPEHPPRRATPPGTVPDFSGLSARQAVVESSRLGLDLTLHDHGTVTRQEPPPGTPFEAAGLEVELWLSREARQ